MAYTETIANHEAHFLSNPVSYVPTVQKTFQDNRVQQALLDPNNDLGKLAPFVINRLKTMVGLNGTLTADHQAVMLSDAPIPI